MLVWTPPRCEPSLESLAQVKVKKAEEEEQHMIKAGVLIWFQIPVEPKFLGYRINIIFKILYFGSGKLWIYLLILIFFYLFFVYFIPIVSLIGWADIAQYGHIAQYCATHAISRNIIDKKFAWPAVPTLEKL